MDQLKQNPFKDRIFDVFAAEQTMEFVDFLDMVSVFSESAPRDVKAEYAFRIYGSNDKAFLDKKDLKHVLDRLCGKLPSRHEVPTNSTSKLSEAERDSICDKIIGEADLDGDKQVISAPVSPAHRLNPLNLADFFV